MTSTELTDTEIIGYLIGTRCACGTHKRPSDRFCPFCWAKLDSTVKDVLRQPAGSPGFYAVWRGAARQLEERRSAQADE